MSVKFNFDPKKLFKPTRDQLKDFGNTIAYELIKNTMNGITSVAGEDRRFPAYKDPLKYPAGLKPQRPVNLTLKGDMLDDLDFDVILDNRGFGIRLFFSTDASATKYKSNHNAETGQAGKRKIIPINKGEKFSKSMEQFIQKELNKMIEKSLK